MFLHELVFNRIIRTFLKSKYYIIRSQKCQVLLAVDFLFARVPAESTFHYLLFSHAIRLQVCTLLGLKVYLLCLSILTASLVFCFVFHLDKSEAFFCKNNLGICYL